MAIVLMLEECMKNFNFDKKAPILLYGAAAIGNIMYNTLLLQGYSVKGLIRGHMR